MGMYIYRSATIACLAIGTICATVLICIRNISNPTKIGQRMIYFHNETMMIEVNKGYKSNQYGNDSPVLTGNGYK